MAKAPLRYRINDPNPAEDTAGILLPLFIEANKPKVDKAIKQAMEEPPEPESHPV